MLWPWKSERKPTATLIKGRDPKTNDCPLTQAVVDDHRPRWWSLPTWSASGMTWCPWTGLISAQDRGNICHLYFHSPRWPVQIFFFLYRCWQNQTDTTVGWLLHHDQITNKLNGVNCLNEHSTDVSFFFFCFCCCGGRVGRDIFLTEYLASCVFNY